MSRRAVKTMILTVCAFAVIGLASADATTTVAIPSHISIKSTGLTFSGRVTSPNSGCVGGRKVTLFRSNGNVLGSTHTGSHGRWKITAEGSAGISLGHFFAKVKRRSEGTAGTIFVCKGARSQTIPFHQ